MTTDPVHRPFLRDVGDGSQGDSRSRGTSDVGDGKQSFLVPRKPRFLSLPPMRYQNRYVWLVLVSALDIMLTMIVLNVWNGYEVNPIANAVIAHMGFVGAIGLKFGIVIMVILICEMVGRHRDRDGRRLATAAVVINAAPVLYTFLLLLRAGAPA